MNSKLFIHSILVIPLLLAVSCNNSKLSDELELMYNQEILFPIDSFQIIADDNQYLTKMSSCRKRFRLYVYADSVVCSSCKIRELEEWSDFVSKCMNYKEKLDVIFVFSPQKKNRDAFWFALKSQKLDFPICIDTTGIFRRANSFLPDNPLLHTFLTDYNKIILVGSPRGNKQINKLFWENVEKK